MWKFKTGDKCVRSDYCHPNTPKKAFIESLTSRPHANNCDFSSDNFYKYP